MFDFEFGQAGLTLEETKDKLRKYLINSYHKDDDNPEKQADKTFKYLEDLVDRIIKRKDYRMQFGSGGSPSWHANIFKYLSRWIITELAMCEMLGDELSKLED